MQQGLSQFEETLALQTEAKRQRRKVRSQGDRSVTDYICSKRVEETATLELASSATQDAVPGPPFRARHHSLPRLRGCQSILISLAAYPIGESKLFDNIRFVCSLFYLSFLPLLKALVCRTGVSFFAFFRRAEASRVTRASRRPRACLCSPKKRKK